MASEETKVAPANPFKLDRDALADFNVDQMREQNKEKLEKYGGVQAVAAALKVDLSSGITGDDAGLRVDEFGALLLALNLPDNQVGGGGSGVSFGHSH